MEGGGSDADWPHTQSFILPGSCQAYRGDHKFQFHCVCLCMTCHAHCCLVAMAGACRVLQLHGDLPFTKPGPWTKDLTFTAHCTDAMAVKH